MVFPCLGSNQYWARRDYGLCVYFITGAPEGSTEMRVEKAGIDSATPGLQGKTHIHYTRVACHKLIIRALVYCIV